MSGWVIKDVNSEGHNKHYHHILGDCHSLDEPVSNFYYHKISIIKPSDSAWFSKLSLVNFILKDWYSIYQFTHWFTLQNGDYGIIIDFGINSTSAMSLKKVQHHVDLIRMHAVRLAFIR